jgi:hypothetical protein
MNRYRPVEDVARKVWSRCSPKTYQAALERNDVTESVPVQDVLQELKLTERIGSVIGQQDPTAVQKGLKSFLLDYKDELDSKDVQISDVTSFVFTERGKSHEEGSLNRVQKTLNTVIKNRNSTFYKRYIEYETKAGTSKFMLGGKVDGITEEGALVEVKNRQNRIFPTMPLYEKCQIHAYMFLTGIEECRFVQSFKGQDVESLESFSPDFWEEVRAKCVDFVRRIEALVSDESMQDRLLSLGMLAEAEAASEAKDDDEEDN